MIDRRVDARHVWAVIGGLVLLTPLAAGMHAAHAAGIRANVAVGTSLHDGFESPPQSARPWLWWHWLNGNVTESGIRQDLQWMHSIGIGGFDLIDAALPTSPVVSKPLVYMTPAWKHAFRYSAQLAGQYGMQLAIDSSPGWSETGGPWVKPGQAMKKLVWTATVVAGGTRFHAVLPQPPANTGPFLDVPLGAGALGPSEFARLRYYRDSMVIAYRAPALDPRAVAGTSSAGPLDAQRLSQLSDGSLTDGPSLEARDGSAWLRLSYREPVRVQGVTLAASDVGMAAMTAVVYVSSDGANWKAVAHMKWAAPILGPAFPERTVSFVPVLAQYVRVVLQSALPEVPVGTPFYTAPGAVSLAAQTGMLKPSKVKPAFTLHELVLHSVATVNQFEAKGYYRIVPDYYAIASSAPIVPGTAVSPKDVVNLTGRMRPDGTLDWTPPPGRWVVLRMGYSLEGTTNHPAMPTATGLEADKLSRADIDSYMEHYLDLYNAAAGPFGRGSVSAFLADSTEIGMQNWTPGLLADFKRLCGYDPTPWLPALTGVVVGSPAESDRFLWDFRHTINELLARNDYAEVQRMAHARGLTTYSEALENGRPSFGDDMQMRQYTDIPMGAMWMYAPGGKPAPASPADIHGAASIAHIYGQNLVGAESLDSMDQPWAFAPQELKRVVDLEFLLGVNRVMIHDSPEQPLDKPPGLSLWFFGQMFDRLDTWAGQAGPWVTYIARCSYLLQQGHYDADIAYFYGQEAPLTSLFVDKAIDVPRGYEFDFVDPDVLEDMVRVDRGELVTRSGMRYRLLYLGGSSRWMTLAVLRRIGELVREGATVVGRRPLGSPSLRDDPEQFAALAQQLFGPAGNAGVRRVGKGEVFTAGALPEALAMLRLQPDFDYSGGKPDSDLRAIHRRLDDGDLYFVSNRRNRAERVTVSFRVTGRAPELWNPVTGGVEPSSYRTVGGRTQVPLRLAPDGSIFVVFRKVATSPTRELPSVQQRTLLTLSGPWNITFQPDRGAPAGIVMPKLASWSGSALSGVKYFSGTATYHSSFRLPLQDGGGRLLLDLGEMHELARVTVNGQLAQVLWTRPFRVDITRYVHPGQNTLAIAVTNLWVNRLIGDQQPGVKHKYTFTAIPTYEPDAPLRVSGLLGPVRLEQVRVAAGH